MLTALLLSPRAESGFVLRVACRRESLREVSPRRLDPLALVISDGSRISVARDLDLDLHRTALSTMIGAASLAVGEGMVLASSTRTHAEDVAHVIVLQLESVAPEPAAPELPGGALRLLDLSAHTSRGGVWPMLPARRLGGLSDRGSYNGVGWLSPEQTGAWFPAEDVTWGGHLDGVFDELQWHDGSTWDDGPWMLVWGEQGRLDTALDTLAARLTPGVGALVQWGLTDMQSQRNLAGGVLHSAGDADAAAMVGELFGVVMGVDVDVATGALTEEPREQDLFDGLLLRARPAGPAEVELSLAASALRARAPDGLGMGSGGLLDRVVFDSADARRLVALDGRRQVLCQLRGPEGEPLDFWVSARPAARQR